MVQIVSCSVIFGSIFARLSFGIPCADPAEFVAEHAQCLTDHNITFTLPNGVNVTADNVVETLTTVLTLADPTSMCSNLDAWGKALECVVSLGEQCPSAGGGTTYSGQKLDELKKIQLETCFHLKRAGSAMIIPTEGQVHQRKGGTLRLACAGVGPGDGAVFHWTDINYHVINNTKGRVHVTDMGTSSILVFSNIQDSDAGSYFCGGLSHAADVSDSVAVNVYDAFYVPTVDCGIMENVHAAFQQCVGYYNITGMMFPVPQGDADIVINAANVFFTQDVPEMCRKRRQFSLAARCVTAISAECLNRNRSKDWLDYFHTGNDVVDGMAVICEAYMSGSYNASCVSSVEDSLVRCVNEEYKTWLSQPVETHGVGKASNTMCRLYSASLDCAEKVLQVCKPKMTTVERFADAYKNMKPSQCATEDGKPGPVTDPWVCSDIGELHAKYKQCLVPGMYNVTLPRLITGSEMAYTIPALVVLQTSADTCSNKASLGAAVQCVKAISRNCVYHTWFSLIPVLPLQAEIDLAIQYKCVFIRAYNASCVAPKAPDMFESAWMKMAHDYNLSYQQNIQAMMCSFRKYVDVVAQTMMSDCGDEAVKTFLAVNNIVAPDNDRCQRFGHTVSIPYIVG